MNGDVEQHYVHEVYTKLAAHSPQSSYDNAPQRSWPNVSKFIQSLETGSVIIDVGEFFWRMCVKLSGFLGCGPNKYLTKKCFMIGVDNCSEVLLKAKNSSHSSREVVIGDALNLPFRQVLLNLLILREFLKSV